ncbi:glycoside hydrolase family 15 protein [Commensalibacter nepenthis]|uniref:Glycoside hydrolase family 15 protein n=1 Tax=Commensalibacter nepenthis TaxID=3043872 RepID=A0ABT6QAA7_9PROT|nr:glycoside hydrolase family 15 protein [Commensalibacter sp. TBRC 10068]MDI2113839.1 glycoside hydrolase family 15 protein [Commensalibacter sp. TBRC 10068]
MSNIAPGKPGISPTWTSSAKDIIGTSLLKSRVWFTVGYGILNEVYWPSCSMPQIRDLGFIVVVNGEWFEVKRLHNYTVSTPSPELLLPKILHKHKLFTLELEIIVDPLRDVLLIHYELKGKGAKLYSILAPHLGGHGKDNIGFINSKGLIAQKKDVVVMLAADKGFSKTSVGYVGISDGWQDFNQNGQMTWEYSKAGPGNIAMMGELNENKGVISLSFANTIEGTQTLAYSSMATGYSSIRNQYITCWQEWFKYFTFSKNDTLPPAFSNAIKTSMAVIKSHAGGTFPGALVASLSIPWGYTRQDIGGYHLVWPRDLVEVGFSMLICGMLLEAQQILSYLISIQQPDGHWIQNNFADGRPYWQGLQLDEVAFPVLFAVKLQEQNLIHDMQDVVAQMIKKAITFIVQNGPISPQDRWEENSGISPFTLSLTISALVAGASSGFLDKKDAEYALKIADDWNNRLESWVYVQNTDLDKEYQISGHYIRINPSSSSPQEGYVELRNRNGKQIKTSDLLGLDYLYLTRLGLRKPTDPRIIETTKLIDKVLCVTLPNGPYYYRYNEDGYGEHEDGSAFDGNGIGRLWPFLSGERGHQAILCKENAEPYLKALLASASIGGMLPEQIWDQEDIPQYGLYKGRPSGSAMPLIWAHAELIKLIYTYTTKKTIEQLDCVVDRYLNTKRKINEIYWYDDIECSSVSSNYTLWIQANKPFTLHYGLNGWQQVQDQPSHLIGLGMYGVPLNLENLSGQTINFTRRFNQNDWENKNWDILVN